jgi:hypothetical protein
VLPGHYTITAIAADNDGAESASTPVRITVLGSDLSVTQAASLPGSVGRAADLQVAVRNEGPERANGAASYTIVKYAVGVPGENNWRRCEKCQTMYSFHQGPWASVCPKDGKHAAAAGLGYSLQY